MTFLNLIKVKAPAFCGVHPSFGEVARLVQEAEEFGNNEFKAEKFKTTRERALIFAPYEAQSNIGTHNQVIDLIEYAICSHRQKEHGEDYGERIGILTEQIGESPDILEGETLKAGTRGWWNQ